MITWFDALLVTLLALAAALGARRGLAGLAWGLGVVAVCFISNFFLHGWPALVLALLLGYGAAWLAQRLIGPALETWQIAVGAVGGLLVGLVLVGSLALDFPVGADNQYPTNKLPISVHDAVVNSYVQKTLFPVFSGNDALKTLLIPDYSQR